MKKNQKLRKEEVIKLLKKQKIRDVEQIESYKLSVCHPDSSGIDLGSNENYVALNPSIAAEMGLPIVHTFNTMTSGHEACRDLLLHCGIKTVCMESTGVYWINLHYTLTQAGIEVYLVNPKMFRMVPGRKTDILDCQWLQTLHMYGLVRGSFIPKENIRQLRSYMRERGKLIQDRARYVQRMQKAMVEMNLMLVNVISDITGKTGIRIVEAILKGERDAKVLAHYRDGRCKKSEREIEESLKGIYKQDQLNLLKINYELYKRFNEQLDILDIMIGDLLKSFPIVAGEEHLQCKKKPDIDPETGRKNCCRNDKNGIRAGLDLQTLLLQITGVDLTAITGLQSNAILQIIAEVGTDMSIFPSEKNFVSYLGFAPRNKITGGVVISSRTDRKKTHAAQAFRKVIPAISKGRSSLSSFYHRIAGRAGTGIAIIATCRKLAIRFYNSLKYGKLYVEQGEEVYRKKLEQRELLALERLARKHNFELRKTLLE
jgi:transposase